MGRRVILLVLGALAITLLMSGVAVAGYTPQDVYDDFADNGVLDNDYTDDELCAYLNDAQIHEYGDSTITKRLDDLVKDACSRDTFPFTGFMLLIAGSAAVVLIGLGILLRRLSRPQDSSLEP